MRPAHAALLVTVAILAASMGGALGAAAEPDATVVEPEAATVDVEATRDILVAQSSVWLDAVSESDLTTLNLRSVSSATARSHLLTKAVDGAVSGTPLTDAEKARTPGVDYVAVPFHVSAAMVIVSEPYPVRFRQRHQVSIEEDATCDPQGDDYDQTRCEVRTDLTTPIRVPPANLSAMMLGVHGDRLDTWRHPDVLAALNAPDLDLPDRDVPTVVHREPGESVNLHLQQYVKTAAPSVWERAKAESPGVEYEVDESIPRSITRSSPTFQAQQVGLWSTDPRTGGATTAGWAGNMVAVPPSALLELKETFPLSPNRVVQVRNGANEYVAPTPASISKAIEVGGAEPLAALTRSIPGAYPLAWVDNLYLPARGLDTPTVNALAAVIRYVATIGQDKAASLGEGRLSPALTKVALTTADDLVKANCSGPERRLARRTDPGPYAAPALTTAGIGEMTHCDVVEAAAVTAVSTTTTVEPTTSTTTAAPSTTSSSTVPAASQPAPSTTTTAATAVGSAVGSGGESASGSVGGATSPVSNAALAGAATGAALPSGGTRSPAASASSATASPSAPARILRRIVAPFPTPAALGRRIGGFSSMLIGAALYLGARTLLRRRMAGSTALER